MEQPLVDVLWVLISAALVFAMQAGFLCLEAGLTRSKNSINVAIKNVADFGISTIMFWLCGFAFMFGLSRGGWFGTSHFAPDLSADSGWLATFFIFQLMFCGTAVTIMSGAVAERMRFGAYLAMSLLVSAIVYPIFGHWAWGGAYAGEPGWLASMGFVDFAGSTVVHSVGGWAALAVLLIIGARHGRFPEGEAPRKVPGSNLPLAMLGVLLLWFGWIGFNGGSTLSLNASVPLIIVNTMIAAGAGMAVSMLIGRLYEGYSNPSAVINGLLAGLVAITANCHSVTPLAAVVIGSVGAAVCFLAERQLERWKLDDAVGAIPVHLVAGIWGTMAVALFGDPEILGTGLSVWGQLKIQALGVVACGGVTFGVVWVGLRILHHLIPLRVSQEDEAIGLNVAEHHATTELFDFVKVIETQAQTQDLSLRADVEPFTEVGQLAARYNALMDILQQSKIDIEDLQATETLLRDATQAAEEANFAKSEFLANMSHEIRTPLHGILSFAGFGMKRKDRVDPEKLGSYFQKIDISARRLLMLVNDLLDIAKLESGKMTFDFEDADVTVLINCVVDEFASLLSERKVKVNFERPANAIRATVDGNKIMQVVRNLLSNAIKFSPENGGVDIDVIDKGEQVRVVVRDHGVGVPEDELDVIFDKFIQSSKTKSGAGGTGLGLAICVEIAKGHGGRVWAENHPEGGAVLTFEFFKKLQQTNSQPSTESKVAA